MTGLEGEWIVATVGISCLNKEAKE